MQVLNLTRLPRASKISYFSDRLLGGRGAPIVTTTDGHSNPIVWVLGAEGDNQLHGFRGDTGEKVFNGPPQAMTGLHHFQTLIATEDRLYVAADGSMYAFRF